MCVGIYLAVTYPPKKGCSVLERKVFLRIFVRELSILVNPEIIPILSGFHSGIIRTRKRPALVLISDTKLLCKNDYKTISAA